MSVNSEICRARTLFISRGILNREIIPDVIVYSWVRSKLHNISIELLDIKTSKKNIDLLSLDVKSSKIIKYLRSIQSLDSVIYLSDEDGMVLYNSDKMILELPVFTNLSEENIGTNAGGISVITRDSATVTGCEHYNKILTNYISSSLVIEEDLTGKMKIVTVITPKKLILSHERVQTTLQQHFIKEEEPFAETTEIPLETGEKADVNPIKSENLDNSPISLKPSDDKACKVFTLSIIEEDTIRSALQYFNWNLKKASEALGIGRSTLYRKLKEYDINKD